MEIDEALQLFAGITYKPRWSFRAQAHPRYDGTIVLSISYPVRNSDVKYAPDYEEPVKPMPYLDFYLYVQPCQTALDVYGLVFDCLLQIERHEAREFFAVDRDTYPKPFHPHTTEGVDNWATRRAITELDDMRFGVMALA